MSLSISKQLDDLEKQIERKLGMNGLDEVAETVREEGKKQVQETVYDVYPNPLKYERQHFLKNSWGISLYTPMTIGVFSDRWDGDRYVSKIVETGEGYMHKGFPDPYPYEQPRPFVQNTINSLKVSGDHVEAYAKALNNVGIKARVK